MDSHLPPYRLDSIGMTIGVSIGLLSAYYGGKVDFIVQRFVDTMFAFPGILLALMLINIARGLGCIMRRSR